MDIKFAPLIFGYNNNVSEKQLLGLGFFVFPNFLVTAGHVVSDNYAKTFANICIKYRNSIEKLRDPLYLKFQEKYSKVDTIYHDLAIYHTTIIDDSIFGLSPNEAKENTILNHYNNNGFGLEYVKVSVQKFAYKICGDSKILMMENCFQLDKFLNLGDSGSPLFINKICYGMITYSINNNANNLSPPLSGTIAIKSSYILSIIKTLIK